MAVQRGIRAFPPRGLGSGCFTSRQGVGATDRLVRASGIALALVLVGCREQSPPIPSAPVSAGAGVGARAEAGDQATSGARGADGAAAAGVSPPSGSAGLSGAIPLPGIATSSQAKHLLMAVRTRLGAAGVGASDGGFLGYASGFTLPAGLAEAFHAAPGGGLAARFAVSAERASAKVISPDHSLASVHIEDTATRLPYLQ